MDGALGDRSRATVPGRRRSVNSSACGNSSRSSSTTSSEPPGIVSQSCTTATRGKRSRSHHLRRSRRARARLRRGAGPVAWPDSRSAATRTRVQRPPEVGPLGGVWRDPRAQRLQLAPAGVGLPAPVQHERRPQPRLLLDRALAPPAAPRARGRRTARRRAGRRVSSRHCGRALEAHPADRLRAAADDREALRERRPLSRVEAVVGGDEHVG